MIHVSGTTKIDLITAIQDYRTALNKGDSADAANVFDSVLCRVIGDANDFQDAFCVMGTATLEETEDEALVNAMLIALEYMVPHL